MTIPFEKLKARLLSNPKVRAEYDALAPEFEIAAELRLKARLRVGLSQAELAARMGTEKPVRDRTPRERPDASEHQDGPALRKGDRQQVPRAAFGGLTDESDQRGRRAANAAACDPRRWTMPATCSPKRAQGMT